MTEKVKSREATPQSAPSQKALSRPLCSIFPQYFWPITNEAITNALVVFRHSLPLISQGFMEYNSTLNPLQLKEE